MCGDPRLHEAALHQLSAWQLRDQLKLWRGDSPQTTATKALIAEHEHIIDLYADYEKLPRHLIAREANNLRGLTMRRGESGNFEPDQRGIE